MHDTHVYIPTTRESDIAQWAYPANIEISEIVNESSIRFCHNAFR